MADIPPDWAAEITGIRNNPIIRTDPKGTIWVEVGLGVGSAVVGIWLFKDCMERCTGVKLPRDPKTCPSPPAGRTATCLESCFSLVTLLQGLGGLGEALVTFITGVETEVWGVNEK